MRRRLAIILGLVAVMGAACGSNDSGSSASVTKTVAVEMRDLAYSPKAVTVAKGATIRFVFTNKGKVAHDAFLGDQAAQTKHEEEMRGGGGGMAGMGHGGDSEAITVQPGKTGELQQTFDKAGTTLIGCHEPGHYAAGMKLTVTVS